MRAEIEGAVVCREKCALGRDFCVSPGKSRRVSRGGSGTGEWFTTETQRHGEHRIGKLADRGSLNR